MSLALRFLGTSASRPTVERNVSSLAVIREGETLMFDCGEGTQRQMMRYGISFALCDIFFTHMHADHMLGVTGLLRTLALQGRTEPMNLYGPPGSEKMLWRAIMLGSEKQHFEIKVIELTPETPLKRSGYSILPFPVEHGDRTAIGYHIVEETRLGRFNPEKAKEMGIPEGPLWGKIHKGETVSLPDGRTIKPSELVGPTRPGRRVVLTGDSRPSEGTIAAATGAGDDCRPFRRRDAGNHVRAVLHALPCMKSAGAAGDSLHDQTRRFINENAQLLGSRNRKMDCKMRAEYTN